MADPIPTSPPSGFRDFLPEACALRAASIATISGVYRSFGFSPIATSAVEDLAVLLGKGGGENEKLIFKILKRGEKLDLSRGAAELADLGLRFDLTLPLARYYTRNQNELPRPFKAFHIGPVWRAERAQKGRYREFYQCDVDIVGSDSVQAEIDVLSAMLAALEALGLPRPKVLLNDRSLLTALLAASGVPPERHGQACVILDKQDKLEPAALRAELEAALGGPAAESLAKNVLAASELSAMEGFEPKAAARLRAILDHLKALHGPEGFTFSPSLVRGFDYYTGPVFELRHPDLAGSIGGGGRYDRLTEKFGGQPIPAFGGSLGFERLMLLLEGKGAPPAGPDACVTVFSEELRGPSLALAARLRAAGLAVDVYPGTGKLGAQLKYAAARRAKAAVIMGPDEAAAGRLKLKFLASGEEAAHTPESAVSALKIYNS